jgi:P-type conjugative transfer protein TrbJ
MRKLIIILSITAGISTTASAQFAVFDNLNAALNNTQIIKQLHELQKLAQQIRLVKNQLRAAKRYYHQQLLNLTSLKHVSMGSLNEINRSLRHIDRVANNTSYMGNYIQTQYRILYKAHERVEKIVRHPALAEKFSKERNKEMRKQANKVIATSEANINLSEKQENFLNSISAQANQKHLSPQQVRQIQAELNSFSAQQLAQLKRIIAQYASFSARKYRQTQGKKKDDKAVEKEYNKEFFDSFNAWKADTTEKQGVIPDWIKDKGK